MPSTVPYHLAGFTDVAALPTRDYHRQMSKITGIEYPGGRPLLPVLAGAAGLGALAFGAKKLWNRRKNKKQTGDRRVVRKKRRSRRQLGGCLLGPMSGGLLKLRPIRCRRRR